MAMITASEVARKWELSLRTVQNLCRQGKIPGAERKGRDWLIPADSQRPMDGRSKAAKAAKNLADAPQPLIRKSPFLNMTDLYNAPGTADQVIKTLRDYPEAWQLFSAEIAYSRGQIDEVYAHAKQILQQHSGFYAMISGGMLLALVAMWEGDLKLWQQAKQHIYEAPWQSENDRDIISLSIASTDLSIRNTKDFPEWFYRGRFDHLPADAHPAARVYYTKYLLIFAQEMAAGQFHMEDMKGLALMRSLPFIIEPMIAQTVSEKTIMAEIHLRLLCAITYRQTGDNVNAAFHLDRAIRLCLADGLYGPLVEYRRQLGLFLDDRLALIDPEALRKVKLLHKKLHAGWTRLHNAVLNKQVQVTLTNREREVTRLAAFGLTDAQIAARLHLSESSVKSAIKTAKNKTGVNSRKELAVFI